MSKLLITILATGTLLGCCGDGAFNKRMKHIQKCKDAGMSWEYAKRPGYANPIVMCLANEGEQDERY